MPVFAFPAALWALTALGVLGGIYWFRTRFQRRQVSSLIFWRDERMPHQGGRRLERMQLPLLLFLELTILVLLALGASRPLLETGDHHPPLVVILDDSYSMQAGYPDSARQKAESALQECLDKQEGLRISFLLAGDEPRLVGSTDSPDAGLHDVRMLWQCRSPKGDLDKAISLVRQLYEKKVRILILTDHESPRPIADDSNMEWWSFGRPYGNAAFIAASRKKGPEQDRCLFAVKNFSSAAKTCTLHVQGAGQPSVKAYPLSLNPGAEHQVILEVSHDLPELHAWIDEDPLPMDNQVTVLPDPERTVSVRVRIGHPQLQSAVRSALEACGGVRFTEESGAMVFTDSPAESQTSESWTVRFHIEENAQAYVGPFVLDRNTLLSEGLSLEGVIWSGGAEGDLPGRPIIMAGSVVLMSEETWEPGRHIHVRLKPETSTLTQSVNWPVLVWNILEHRRNMLPGFRQVNVRVGQTIPLVTDEKDRTIRVRTPDGSEVSLHPMNGQAVLRIDRPGIYQADGNPPFSRFSANLLNSEESDLRNCKSGQWGCWRITAGDEKIVQDITWALVLAAITAMLIHMVIIASGRQTTEQNILRFGRNQTA